MAEGTIMNTEQPASQGQLPGALASSSSLVCEPQDTMRELVLKNKEADSQGTLP